MAQIKDSLKKLAEQQRKIRMQVQEKTVGYILAALGFVVALAWNDAISTFIKYIFPLDKNGLLAKFFYALVVTVLIVVATILSTKKAEEKKVEVK